MQENTGAVDIDSIVSAAKLKESRSQIQSATVRHKTSASSHGNVVSTGKRSQRFRRLPQRSEAKPHSHGRAAFTKPNRTSVQKRNFAAVARAKIIQALKLEEGPLEISVVFDTEVVSVNKRTGAITIKLTKNTAEERTAANIALEPFGLIVKAAPNGSETKNAHVLYDNNIKFADFDQEIVVGPCSRFPPNLLVARASILKQAMSQKLIAKAHSSQ